MTGVAASLAADLGGKAARAVLLAAVAFGAFTYTRYLQIKAELAVDAAVQARQGIVERDATILTLRTLSAAQERLAASLDGERTALHQLANTREIQMRKLQDENAEIRAWAAVAVPADVVRLRDHGPITGAASYRQLLSQGATLQPARRAGEE
ncbi:LysB family phage lysis regulatory protein [Duganella sp. SG902]|uniref:LysB family phage lysis regulatory protein n=1 Tax=Duganella sp. SG902 TaxID=2587016 RepID=UPI001845D9E0|nr:LysB family phage lysis regulatory protein [Duganella sp. SG902]NVM80042.1 LysB family phage lysis regulatory protein [Duganella sp. SG902]